MHTIRPFRNHLPRIAEDVWIDPTAVVIGDVEIGSNASIWPHCAVRGDIHRIRIGARSNIQDGSVLHVTHASQYNPEGYPLIVGEEVTVGHRVVLHGCTIQDRCLIGMGAIVLDGAVVESKIVRGAGSLVPGGKVLEGGYLYVGSPVRRVRPLSEKELQYLEYSAANYVRLGQSHRQEMLQSE